MSAVRVLRNYANRRPSVNLHTEEFAAPAECSGNRIHDTGCRCASDCEYVDDSFSHFTSSDTVTALA